MASTWHVSLKVFMIPCVSGKARKKNKSRINIYWGMIMKIYALVSNLTLTVHSQESVSCLL